MIKPEQIPDEVVEAAVKAFDESEEDAYVTHAHDIRVAIAAALAAWPGASMKTTFWPNDEGVWIVPRHGWLLPLPTEARDGE